MTTIERIRAICKERGISISRLEKECGFANAYISQLKKGTMPADRLVRVAQYLEVSSSYLLFGEAELSDDAAAQAYLSDPDIKRFVLFAGGQIPKGDREKFINAFIETYKILNAKKQ